jgi:UDP-N-acetylmuramate--alanine ligase
MFKNFKHIHFIGIGGSGMSGIAEVLLTLGYQVSGSDAKVSDTTQRLEDRGATVFIGHREAQSRGTDVVVTSTAVAADNPEVLEARRLNIPVIPRIEMLAELARLKYTVAVAGTHGKTTTTSLCSLVLTAGGLDPTVVVGGRMHNIGTGARVGKGDYLVAEADESDGSFLKLAPALGVITNVDDDHLDYWKTMGALDQGFADFGNKVPFYGTLFLGIDDAGSRRLRPLLRRRVVTYGISPDADLRAADVRPSSSEVRYDVYRGAEKLGEMRWSVAGRHNVINSLAAIGVGLELEIPFKTIVEALASFKGVGRRMELKGESGGVTVLDDYGHHPTEVRATLQALKERFPDRRKVVLFQPHRYSRTQLLGDEFACCFGDADVLLLLDIYAASEKPMLGVTSDWLADKIRRHRSVEKIPSNDGGAALEALLKPGDVLLTLGAGDVWKLGESFLGSVPKSQA